MEFQEGVYFNLSQDDYMSVPALNAGGVKLLRVSPLEYWMQSAFNPDRDDIEEKPDSFAMLLGAAYHARICEGKAVFDSRFAPKIDIADYPGVLDTTDDLKAVLRQYNEVSDDKAKLSGTKAELIERVLSLNPAAKIWSVILESYLQANAGKQFLPWRNLRRVEVAAKMIEADPQLGKAFTGGAAEVSIFWRCKTHDIPMKVKVDYLKAKAIVELKSWSNPNGRPIDRAITTAFASYRYHIAAALYDEGVREVSRLIREGKIFGEADKTLIGALRTDYEKTYLMVWQHSGVAPIVRGRVLSRDSIFFQAGKTEVDVAKMKYRECMEKFGPNEPWIDAAPIETFDDASIPSYGLE